ncbi:hypothetical protein AKN87_03205 [Thiopseudomonas alkaliphila]|uniref:Uncharacterized protein n=1 Tax=Thiopseudomonas alkaliphila TaxID=1697053 RepID=A0A0K1XH50_9GAMM|nr:hypothetical protein [Thiopseudomonas alkaliphila]AKX45795.1 hypothetical protein AKN87_03205 [Thiopseudomonas alkaliphila]AKX60512.1 hypothetical protein AKN88_01085 [Thiopseudomonas alkaliphila]
MHPVLQKTLGGLSREYYVRQFLFGLIFPVIIFLPRGVENWSLALLPLALISIVNTFLYPYARFVYESVVSFIFGNNVFVMPAVILLFIKLMTMLLCWSLAIFIAPLGLAYLYYHHSKAGSQ